MSTKKRKPSVATQLKNLKAEHAALMQEVSKRLQERDQANQRNDYNNKRAEGFEAELNAMHALLDALPNAIPRKAETSESLPYPQPHPCSTRLAAWLAVRSTL